MPLADFQGTVYTGIRSGHFRSIKLATPGFPFTNAGSSHESNEIGWRDGAEVVVKTPEVTDATMRKASGLTHEVSGKIPLLQTDIATLRNYHLLSKTGCQMLGTLANGDALSFVLNTGDPGSANGSCLLGLKPKFSVDAKKRMIELDIDGVMSDEEVRWLAANLGTPATGGSGGVSLGLTAMSYNRSKQRASNFQKITVDGEEVGEFRDDCKLDLTWGGQKVSPGRTLCQYVDLSAEIGMSQTLADDILAVFDTAEADRTVIFYLKGGDTVKINKPGCLYELHYDEKEPYVKMMLSGRWYANADEGTPNSIDIGVGTATQIELLAQWT